MLKLEFPKDKVLEIIKTNRENHIAIADEAKENHKAALIEKLEDMLDQAKIGEHVERHIGLVEPADYREEYDRAISMLELTNADVLTLDSEDYARYVQDDWEWKRNFQASNAGYTTGRF